MKFLIFFCLLAFALAEEDCGEESAEACVENLLISVLDDISEEQFCGELRTSVECLTKAVDVCLRDEKDEDAKEGLQELNKFLRDECGEGDVKPDAEGDVDSCYSENEEYIDDCIYEGPLQALAILMEQDKLEENGLVCLRYTLTVECLVERTGEKCGEEAREEAKKALMDEFPGDINEACEASGINCHFNCTLLLGEKRKK